ncbi:MULTISPECIES: replication initiation protein [Carnobacterium]|uniref:replication initiation protein n=1 Tax=Carnobacterium TaxID=2747 RepID=UPI00128AEEC3|nr:MULTISPECIES: replication initiation protein [Carnobacterium]MDT1940712.1 replication initiation protein [Carnobacterium divergens]MDT1943150.1 replication initiation protein [Carnobacterium divergens]MDT1948957.1 replication initiation protein [Carnobacterium divergens]MDT1951438.1 replication initiation protein [Carnobacterium divergens]MDT1956615.1 replication initiation protein [Carnobacterium divergens]
MNAYVKYKNELNTISFGKFNAVELNLFFAMLSKATSEHKQLFQLSLAELRSLAHYNPTSNQQLLTDLTAIQQKLTASKYIHSYRNDNTIGLEDFVFFEEFHFLKQSKSLEIKINPKFTCLLNQVPIHSTCFALQDFLSLKKVYAKQLFRLLTQYQTLGYWEVPIENLVFLLSIPESYQIGQIDQKIVNPAIAELMPFFTSLRVEKIYGSTQGNKVTAYIFHFKKN